MEEEWGEETVAVISINAEKQRTTGLAALGLAAQGSATLSRLARHRAQQLARTSSACAGRGARAGRSGAAGRRGSLGRRRRGRLGGCSAAGGRHAAASGRCSRVGALVREREKQGRETGERRERE